MDIGKHIIARALADRTVRPFTEAGLSAAWLGEDESAAVFEGLTARAWQFLLAHADRHGRTPRPSCSAVSSPKQDSGSRPARCSPQS